MLIEDKPQTNSDSENIINNNSKLKDLFTSTSSKELTGHKKRVYTIDWNSTGTKLASGSVDCSIRVRKNKINFPDMAD